MHALTHLQASAILAAGEEAKLMMISAVDAEVHRLVQQLHQTDHVLLGGDREVICEFLNSQLQRAVSASESPPASALPCLPGSEAAMALAAAYMTSELKGISRVAQFIPKDKEQFRSCMLQNLPSIGDIRAPEPSSPPHSLDCEMPRPPLHHFDFSSFDPSLIGVSSASVALGENRGLQLGNLCTAGAAGPSCQQQQQRVIVAGATAASAARGGVALSLDNSRVPRDGPSAVSYGSFSNAPSACAGFFSHVSRNPGAPPPPLRTSAVPVPLASSISARVLPSPFFESVLAASRSCFPVSTPSRSNEGLSGQLSPELREQARIMR